jgi:hypothetical protein
MNCEFAPVILIRLGAGLATAASFGFGLLSGMFIGRALWVWS